MKIYHFFCEIKKKKMFSSSNQTQLKSPIKKRKLKLKNDESTSNKLPIPIRGEPLNNSLKVNYNAVFIDSHICVENEEEANILFNCVIFDL
jgi:hypothetical protein